MLVMTVCSWDQGPCRLQLGFRVWGWECYEQAFRTNNVDMEVLPSLTAEDLRDLGVDL